MSNRAKQKWMDMAQAVAAADMKGRGFKQMLAAAGLDPARDLRFADWSGVDFSGCDLSGCDFTGARLHGCIFDGALIAGRRSVAGEMMAGDPLAGILEAIFDQAELGQVIHRPDRDPHAPAEMTEIANLRAAKDWTSYADPKKWHHQKQTPPVREHLPVGAIFQDAPIAPEMVVVPAGQFVMGSPKDELERRDDESPQREVTITQPFAVGRYAITFDEWDACVADGGCSHKPDDEGWRRGNRPVIDVSWNDAQAYVKWLSKKTGKRYRLPTEAEWEYVARAGTITPFWWGKSITPKQANYYGNFVYEGGGSKGKYREKTVPVDHFDPNPFGLYNVHGNVFEWVEDCYVDSYKNAPIDGSANTSGNCDSRVLRGGSWVSDPWFLRSASRLWFRPDFRYSNLGFRVARTL